MPLLGDAAATAANSAPLQEIRENRRQCIRAELGGGTVWPYVVEELSPRNSLYRTLEAVYDAAEDYMTQIQGAPRKGG